MTETMSCGCVYRSEDGAPPWHLVEMCPAHTLGRMLRLTR